MASRRMGKLAVSQGDGRGDCRRASGRLGGIRSLTVAVQIVALLCGCRAGLPPSASQPAYTPGANAGLMEHISNQPFVTADAGYRAVYVLWRGEAFDGDFAALTQALEGGRVVGRGWKLRAGDFLDRAAVGHLVARAARIESGVNWRLTGLGRYGWRELQYHDIAGPGGEWGLVSGGEFLGIVARADAFMRARGQAGPQPDLGPAPAMGDQRRAPPAHP